MLLKDRYKLLYYFGYERQGIPTFARLYDVQSDPEELEDLFLSRKAMASALLTELKAQISEVNQPYSGGS
jgi:hypothetical protein